MLKVFIAPRRYVQGVGALAELGKYVASLGKRALIAWGPLASKMFAAPVTKNLKEHGIDMVSFEFSGECDRGQIKLGVEKAQAEKVDVVIGIGGGKAIDLAKAVSMATKTRMVSVPTIASNDAPTSAATVYYTEDGVMDGWDIWPFNPDLVIVDTQVIANAPVRWFVSGIADGLATWFEAEACYKGRRQALAGGVSTLAALNLARLCYDTLMEYSFDAKRDVEHHVVTPAVEKVVEANTLLSGLGFESAGVASAHAVGNGLTMLARTRQYSHGERVAFGIVTQLCLDEDTDVEERLAVVDFLIDMGLPVTFADVGLGDVTPEELQQLATAFVAPGQITHNHVFAVTAFDMYSALVAADALGRSRKVMLSS
jgi:glycerol dehydrogenase